MAHDVRIAISCPDRTGLLSAVAGRLFELGADMRSRRLPSPPSPSVRNTARARMSRIGSRCAAPTGRAWSRG